MSKGDCDGDRSATVVSAGQRGASLHALPSSLTVPAAPVAFQVCEEVVQPFLDTLGAEIERRGCRQAVGYQLRLERPDSVARRVVVTLPDLMPCQRQPV